MEASEFDGMPGLASPSRRALAGAGYTKLGQLAGAKEADLAQLHGIGPKALRVLAAALAEEGKSVAK